jgi:hypothetical protein
LLAVTFHLFDRLCDYGNDADLIFCEQT